VVPPPPPPHPVVVVSKPAAHEPFLVQDVSISGFETCADDTYFTVNVTATDGFAFTVKRKYSAFESFHRHHQHDYRDLIHRGVTLPPKPHHLFRGPSPEEWETLRIGLHAWFASVVDFARNNSNKHHLQKQIHLFVDFSAYYRSAVAAQAVAGGVTAVAAPTVVAEAVPVVATTVSAAPAPAPAPAPSAPPKSAALSAANPFAPAVSAANPFAPAAAPAHQWEAAPFKAEYDAVFDGMGPSGPQGQLLPAQAREALLRSNLPNEVLMNVWELSDLDKDGMLDKDEFAVAMYLCRQASCGNPVPAQLPRSMCPASKLSLLP